MAQRGKRWLTWTLVALILLLLVAWLALPAVVVAAARKRLPVQLDRTLTITHAATAPTAVPAQAMARLVLSVSPERIHALAASQGQTVPTLLLRDGMSVRGAWHDAKLVPELPVELVGVVHGAADPPLAGLAVPAGPLAELIARTAEPVVLGGNSLRWSYRLDPGTVLAHDGPPVATATGMRRRFRAEASGVVTVDLGEARCEVRVTRLTGHIDLALDRRADGWHLHGIADVDVVEKRIVHCTSPVLEGMAGNLETVLEFLLNSNVLSERAREKEVLPLWFPIDLGIQAVVVAEPGDCAAAVAAMLPLR